MTLKHSIILHIIAHCFEPNIILVSSSLKIRHVWQHRSYNTSMLSTLYRWFFDNIQAPKKTKEKDVWVPDFVAPYTVLKPF